MGRGIEGNEIATPKTTPKTSQSALKSSSKGNQKTLFGFFGKSAASAPAKPATSLPQKFSPVKKVSAAELTPAPSSDGPEMSSPSLPSRTKLQTIGANKSQAHGKIGLPSPASSAIAADAIVEASSPSRKVLN